MTTPHDLVFSSQRMRENFGKRQQAGFLLHSNAQHDEGQILFPQQNRPDRRALCERLKYAEISVEFLCREVVSLWIRLYQIVLLKA